MSKSLIAAILAAGVLLPFCVQADTTAATLRTYQKAYGAALAVHAKVIAQDNQWTTTVDVLAASRKAAKHRNFGQAVALAQRAEHLAKLALRQESQQQKVWKKAVPG